MTQKKQKPFAYSSSLQVVVSLLKNKKYGESIAILEELEKKEEGKKGENSKEQKKNHGEVHAEKSGRMGW